jgi:integrase
VREVQRCGWRNTVRGKQVRESACTEDRDEAKRSLAARIAENRIRDRRKIGTLLEDLITDYRVNGKDLEWCERYVRKQLQPTFENRKAENLTKQDVTDCMAEMLKSGYSNATINRCVALLRAFRLADIRFPRVEHLRENIVRTGFVDEDPFWKLYEKLPQHQQPVALLAYETGARKKELLRLKWNQIDLKIRIVRLNPGETRTKTDAYSRTRIRWRSGLRCYHGYRSILHIA